MDLYQVLSAAPSLFCRGAAPLAWTRRSDRDQRIGTGTSDNP